MRRAGSVGSRGPASTISFRVFTKWSVPARSKEDMEDEHTDVDRTFILLYPVKKFNSTRHLSDMLHEVQVSGGEARWRTPKWRQPREHRQHGV